MNIVKYKIGERAILGLLRDGKILNLSELDSKVFGSFTNLITEANQNKNTINQLIDESIESSHQVPDLISLDETRLLLPLDPPEVWGCGVTYSRSQEAREYETGVKGIYDLVYSAERPETFFKTTGIRCVGPYQHIGIRGDSSWSVPEPELGFILGLDGEIVGFTAGNDVSARDIEGENPLYLPQAKIFEGCCSLGPSVLTTEEVGLNPKLKIKCEIIRDGLQVFSGETNTSRMKRSIEELRSYLCRYNPIPSSSVCLTGTGIVPPDEFALQDKDIVNISIEKIGTLVNPVKKL